MPLPLIQQLMQRGVHVPDPSSVFIAPDVDADRIAKDVTLFPGCRLEGASTSIGPGSAIGSEGPVVLRQCQLGHKVSLGSGFFEGSVFLDGASMGGGSHVRPGCLVEEQAGGAHTVGLKQTVLMPYVTLGSLINFCDCLMAGGTSRKNHSEVGSSYIHFNFTPHQDKATPSLIGDVPRGVLLDQPPIFLGGQGGLVGPARVAFGSVIAAGKVLRHDVTEPGMLVVPAEPPGGTRPYDPATYGPIDRVVKNNLRYIGNIRALSVWYRVVRKPFMSPDPYGLACAEGALAVLGLILEERVKRLAELAGKMPASIESLSRNPDEKARGCIRDQQELAERWPGMQKQVFAAETDASPLAEVVSRREAGAGYLDWIRALTPADKSRALQVLEGVVASAMSIWK